MPGPAAHTAAVPAALSSLLTPVSFDALPGWRADSLLPALRAFARSAHQVVEKPYRTGSLGIALSAFAEAHAAARALSGMSAPDETTARAFFESHFIPCRVAPADGGHGFVTGYYEPEAEASRTRTARFTVPLYARPADLVDVDDASRPEGLDPYFAFAAGGMTGGWSRISTARRSIPARSRAGNWSWSGWKTGSTPISSMSRAPPG